jgi:hypothetical protein
MAELIECEVRITESNIPKRIATHETTLNINLWSNVGSTLFFSL